MAEKKNKVKTLAEMDIEELRAAKGAKRGELIAAGLEMAEIQEHITALEG
jgi:hypothetical protein